jgi:hypothetical protein
VELPNEIRLAAWPSMFGNPMKPALALWHPAAKKIAAVTAINRLELDRIGLVPRCLPLAQPRVTSQ